MTPAIRSVTEQVADGLRARIRDERLGPGDRLGGEHELAREFGVSRPTMREALRLLSHGGLLRSTRGPAGGTFVERDAAALFAHGLDERITTLLAVGAFTRAELIDARQVLEAAVTLAPANPVLEASVHWARRLDAAEARVPAPAGAAAVARRLQTYVLREGFAPGDRLGREDELAATLGTTRSVLREAVQILTAAHLVRVGRGPGGGVFLANTFADGLARMVSTSVAGLLEADLVTPTQLFTARIAIEPGLAASVARATGADRLDALRDAIAAEAVAHRDAESRTRAHVLFHRLLADGAANRVVAAITAWIFDVLDPQLVRFEASEPDPAAAVDQHGPILGAIAAGDAARTERLMREHLVWLESVVSLGATA